MILIVAWAEEHELLGQDVIGYDQHWDRGATFENDRAKLVWDFEFHLHKTTASRSVILELKSEKKLLCAIYHAHNNRIY